MLRVSVAVVVVLAAGLMGCSAQSQDAATLPTPRASLAIPGLNFPQTLGVPEIAGEVVSGGERPVLSWDAPPGAVTYQLILRNEAGETTWAWTGSTTSIAVGGGAAPAASDTPAALISGPSSWTVVALDAASKPVAATRDIEVSP